MKYMHIRLPNSSRGGVTLAYEHPFPRANTVKVATAVCSAKDQFHKETGRTIAASNLQLGFAINLPVDRNMSIEKQLHDLFFRLVTTPALESLKNAASHTLADVEAITNRKSRRRPKLVATTAPAVEG